MGQVITVLAENGEFSAGFNAQMDGFKISGGSRVPRKLRPRSRRRAAQFTRTRSPADLEVSNNLIQSNAGQLGGGVILGQPNTPNPTRRSRGQPERRRPDPPQPDPEQRRCLARRRDRALQRGPGLRDRPQRDLRQLLRGVRRRDLELRPTAPARSTTTRSSSTTRSTRAAGSCSPASSPRTSPQVSPGTGDISVARNRIQGNVSNDDGGGIRLLQPVDGGIRIVNNMVVNNLATDAGGGISMDDALDVEIVNNTVARNVSTSTAEDAPVGPPDPNPPIGRTTLPQGAGIVSELHSQALLDARGLPAGSFSDPVLFNNIIWENQACYLDGELQLEGTNGCEAPGPAVGRLHRPRGERRRPVHEGDEEPLHGDRPQLPRAREHQRRPRVREPDPDDVQRPGVRRRPELRHRPHEEQAERPAGRLPRHGRFGCGQRGHRQRVLRAARRATTSTATDGRTAPRGTSAPTSSPAAARGACSSRRSRTSPFRASRARMTMRTSTCGTARPSLGSSTQPTPGSELGRTWMRSSSSTATPSTSPLPET